MTKSAFVEVNITNPTKLAQDSQDTANTAVKGVTDLNDPNLMSVIEKQNNVVQFAGLTSQYNVIVQNAKDEGINTDSLTTAYNNLNKFMIDVLTDPDHASDVDRKTYKNYQDTYNYELAKIQTALKNNTDGKFTSAANATSQAASTASQAFSAANGAFSQAQLIGSQADSAIAVQSQATTKAQSTADNAFSQAQVIGSQASADISINSMATAKAQSTADNAFSQAQAVGSQASAEIAIQSEATLKAQNTADSAFKQAQSATDYTDKQITSQASAVSEVSKNASEASSQANSALDAANSANAEITNLKGGSTLTIAKLEDGLGTKVDNGDFSTYKTQTASQFAETVKEADFKTYQTQTSKLIEAKVDNGTYQSDKTQTAKDISSKVSSSDFNTYKTQTADLINDKVSNSEYASDKTQTASQISQMVSNSAFSTYQTQTASQIAQTVSNSAFSAYQQTTADLIASKVATKDFSAYQATTAKSIESKVESKDFNTYKTQTADLIDDKVSSSQYSSDKTQTASEIADRVSNSAFSTYQTQTASQIASKVDNGDFSTYKTQTADLISAKVSTKGFSAYQDTTAKAISSKVESSDFNTYKTQTAGLISSKVDSGDFSTYKTQTDKLIEAKVDNGTYQSDKTQTANDIASKVANKDFETYKSQTADLISSKVATKDFNTYTSQTATAISSKVESSDFNTYKTQTDSAINDKVSSAKYASDKTQTDNAILSKVSKKDANNVNLIPYSSNFSDSLEGWQLMDWGATDRKLLVTTHSFYQNGTGKLLYLNTAQNATSAAGSLRFSVLPNTKYTFQFKAFASSNVVGANVCFLSRAYGSTSDYDTVHGLFNNLVTSPSHIDQYTVTFTTGSNDNEGYIRVDNIGSNNSASSGLFFTELKMEPGDTATPYVYGGQDSMISQMAGDINLRVTKDGLLDQINLQAGKTLISSSGQLTLSGKNIYFDSANPVIIPSANIDTALVNKKLTAADISANTFTTNNGTFTVDKNGAITARNMTLSGGTLTSPTINASKINSATINGTTINAGDIINNANNTSHFYPTTISNNGHIYTVQFNSSDAMQTDLSTGSLTTKYRAVNSTGTQYEAYDTMIQANQIALFAGHTNGKDMSFTQSVTGSNQDGYMLLSPLNGITLHGDTQQITFNGTSDDVTPKGIIITPYGNINPNGTQNIWYIGNGPDMKTASFGINADQNVPISFYRQTLVDEIGALGNRLSMGRLFLHATDNNAQMYLLNDSKPAFVSPTIYNRTYSNGANMFVTSSGRVGRSTSASKYKLAITRSDDTTQADRLMTLNPASWNDKVATEKMAESLSNGEIPVEAEINLKRHYGLIAEDLRDAGLDEFLITGKDGQIEGIEYDRLWTVLIPKIKQLNNRINELERKTL